MARLVPKELSLSDSEQNELQELINRHKTPQQIVIRAKIINSSLSISHDDISSKP
jgi:putative transposase